MSTAAPEVPRSSPALTSYWQEYGRRRAEQAAIETRAEIATCMDGIRTSQRGRCLACPQEKTRGASVLCLECRLADLRRRTGNTNTATARSEASGGTGTICDMG